MHDALADFIAKKYASRVGHRVDLLTVETGLRSLMEKR
jgi:hypothetical protein